MHEAVKCNQRRACDGVRERERKYGRRASTAAVHHRSSLNEKLKTTHNIGMARVHLHSNS